MSAHDVFLLGGVFPGTAPAAALRRVVSYARQAESSGLDGVWTAEHHFIEYGASPSATLMAAHLLAATDTIQVGTAVAVLSNRHPVALGEEAATLDALAPGRFRLGVGRGGPWIDLDVFATGLERYERGFEEGLRLLASWLSGEPEVAHTGEFFDVLPVRVMPPGTGAPIWVAATGEGTARLAGRLGLPLMLGMHAPDEEHRSLIGAWREAAEDAGRDPDAAEHVSTHLAQVVEAPADTDRLRASLTELLTRGVGQYVSLKPGRAQRDHGAYVDWMVHRHAVGTASHVAERLAASAAATGVARQLLLVEGLGDEAAVRGNIAALGEALSTAGTAAPAAARP
ncbi:Flavin-dependent oxidoreductase, luciferase family (includes alkanesulfonate monooxygenase SsuD and methylene tetrahydromethanopterin reductase) [Glycomyces sambucus]|uniref:Flavin-dependent oxidoreductase, luciferase family (Includes alkanesulfonate monooxygenase SsuD and methylene tetrahydromethanopterin reductase) n=1 Tax=Glycomyces sambucus TaxID=380244 RepID=A0A1G9DPF1_9ACTN|nr:LLM class flavin-dependent oxidoreductase [Glycomyces sambucus]SDK65665.1 Flavin-dependent oxidoreductase, luciferase family (includes alkanesulfonate monooxygenase SsuD and methylene tetrahydromethanopterin reductase) [Glycomyces sambucus]